jgi:hypothetical protein
MNASTPAERLNIAFKFGSGGMTSKSGRMKARYSMSSRSFASGKMRISRSGSWFGEIVAPRLRVADLFVEINDEQRHVPSAFSPGAQRHQIHDEGQSDSRDSVISIPRRLAVHFWRFAIPRRKVCGVS